MKEMVQIGIYVLCFATSAACAFLLFRGYLGSRTKLLLWSAVSFIFLALNSLVVVFDIAVLPNLNLIPLRYAATLAGIGVLLFGLVWEST